MASKMSAHHLQLLRDQLAAVQGQIRSLQGEEAGLRRAIAIVSDDPPIVASTGPAMRARRSPIKDTVLRMAQAHAVDGVVAAQLVELARAEGIELDRNSVSSLLSKFKRDGVLEYDGHVYRPSRPTLREVKNVA